MQIGLYFLAVIVTLVLQTHLVFRAVSAGWHVDLALLVVVAGCLQWEERRALIFGFMTGLLHDVLSSDMMGLNAVSKASTAFVVLLLSRNVPAHSLLLSSGLAALAMSLDTVTRLFVLAIFQSRTYPLPMILQVVIPHAFLGAVLMPLVHTGLRVLTQALHLNTEQGQSDAPV